MNFDKNTAARLWDSLTVTVDRFAEKVKVHEKSVFLGYADITVDATAALPGFKLKLRGVGVKILKGNPYLDMPSEKGADGQYYPRFFPLTGELRTVMTTACFQNEQVNSSMERAAAAAQPEENADCGTSLQQDNPFAG